MSSLTVCVDGVGFAGATLGVGAAVEVGVETPTLGPGEAEGALAVVGVVPGVQGVSRPTATPHTNARIVVLLTDTAIREYHSRRGLAPCL